MKTDRRSLTLQARRLLAVIVAAVLTALVWVGHVLTLFVGAADALVTARLGVPRVAYICGRLAEVVRQTWKEEV
ncbi:hypothetical protein [Nonomuraea pusilla]|uniref:Uncharacterized protein n=1 Tax=Nonomuraea pusilla TaxID=46177 RepID=A0A1H8K285_9ACTN|nr:hypothetical protein [Nonomuraea pusilla]SEN87052.1 hypothetical protein SAMN05660976_08503 [Nonomuraea pusilla]